MNLIEQLYKLDDRKAVIYDIEVVYGHLIISMMDVETQRTRSIVNPSKEQISRFFERYFLIGFHNQRYDDRILWKYLEMGVSFDDLKHTSDAVIEQNQFLPRPHVRTFDVTHLLRNEHAKSLKEWESARGMRIQQESHMFNQRGFSAEEIATLTEYCEQDVRATYEVLQQMYQIGALSAYIKLIGLTRDSNYMNELPSANNLTKMMLDAEDADTTYDKTSLKRLVDGFDLKYKTPFHDDYLKYSELSFMEKMKLDEKLKAGIDNILVSTGGIHYQNPKRLYCKNVIGYDVTSLYPSVMVLLNTFGELTFELADIMKQRVIAKKNDPNLSDSFKLVINSLYGLMRSELAGKHLYDPHAGFHTCAVGNVVFYDLIRRFEEIGAVVVQANTDGIFIDADTCDIEVVRTIMNDAAERTKLNFEEFTLTDYFARDVNNYFCTKEDGKKKAKGIFADNKTVRDMKVIPAMVMYMLEHQGKLDMDFWQSVKFDDFLRRAKATGQYIHARFSYTETPRISAKTGKILKGSEITYKFHSPVGKVIRGYVSTDKQSLICARTNDEKVSKISKVPQEYFKLMMDEFDINTQEIPADLDLSWYEAEATKEFNKILNNIEKGATSDE